MVASPWLDIPLAEYEGHMALPEIAQARMLADELESAVRQHAPSSVAIIGCSGTTVLSGSLERRWSS
jgi:hypothetical protein